VDSRALGGEREEALHLADRVRLGPFLTVELGLRHERFELPGGVEQEHTSPRLGLVWDVGRKGRSRLVGSYGEARQAPGLGEAVREGDPVLGLAEHRLAFETEPLPNLAVTAAAVRQDREAGAPERYEAVELSLRRRFADGFQLYASYINADDPRPLGRRHQVRVLGSVPWPGPLTTGFLLRYYSDQPPVGAGVPLPDLAIFDLRLEVPLRPAPGDLRLSAELLNLSNENDPTAAVDVEPRHLRVGLGVSW
jgi:outer membrane receptor protein involved in Fe transport